MKIREIIQEHILQERISLTSYLPTIQNTILGALNKTATEYAGNHPSVLPQNPEFDEIISAMRVFSEGLAPAITPLLVDCLTKLVKQMTNFDVKVEITELDKGVGGSYIPETNTLKLTSEWPARIGSGYFWAIAAPKRKIDILKKGIGSLAGVIIHESTHVIQTNGGARVHEKSMIYNKDAVDAELATIEPNKKKQSALLKATGSTRNQINLIVAKRNLTDPKNVAIYKAQPEEITAFAHEFISKELATMVNQPVDIQKQFINNSLRELSTQAKVHQYSNMADYTKVYRRFLKAVYLELISYSESL